MKPQFWIRVSSTDENTAPVMSSNETPCVPISSASSASPTQGLGSSHLMKISGPMPVVSPLTLSHNATGYQQRYHYHQHQSPNIKEGNYSPSTHHYHRQHHSPSPSSSSTASGSCSVHVKKRRANAENECKSNICLKFSLALYLTILHDFVCSQAKVLFCSTIW